MKDIIIRNYERKDEAAIEDIIYRTGFKGEDLTGRGFFDDRRLLFLMFKFYYTECEPEHFFVAVDPSTDAVVGFIGGTTDTIAQEKRYLKKVIGRIVLRALFFTSWWYPETFKTLSGMSRMREAGLDEKTSAAIHAEYPAHLHINLLPDYQGQGLGTRLMKRFERHLISQNVSGVHLRTSNHNHKALSFYEKMGYTIVHKTASVPHPAANDFRVITYAKKLVP